MKFKFLFTLLLLGYLNASAGGDNIASTAKISVSTTLSNDFSAQNVTDGIIGINGKGEWACKGQTAHWGYVRFPWIQLDWEDNVMIDRIVLYDRPGLKEFIGSGKLMFSDGSEVWVNSIPNNGTAKAVVFKTKKIKWLRFVVTDGDGNNLGLSEIEVFRSPENNRDYTSLVDPYIETNRGRFFYFITGCRPFGMMSAAPHTRNKNQWGGGYNYNENQILGFAQIHDWSLSGLEIMPTAANTGLEKGKPSWQSEFSHDDEIVQPGYHRVFLRDHKIWTELTSTDRVSFYRFTFTQDMKAQVITNLGGLIGGTKMVNARVNRVSGNSYEGSFSSVGRLWGGPKDVKVFFVVKLDKEFKTLTGWKGKKNFENIDKLNGDSLGISPQYEVLAGDQLQMKIAISYTSLENARHNLEVECPGWDFNLIRNESKNVWNDWLGKIDVKGGSIAQQRKFYTDLWHVLLGRHKITDVSGDYPDRSNRAGEPALSDTSFRIKQVPKMANGLLKYDMYNTDAWWLTQWNLNVLWGLGWPEVQDDMSSAMLQFADDGGLLPRGPVGGGDTFIMTSSPVTNLIAGTYMKGLLTKADPVHAFDIIRRNHLPGGVLGSKEHIEFYTKNGYFPGNAGITVEAVFQDYAIAQMAYKLNRKEDYNFFMKRSEGWKKLYEPKQKLLFPKNEAGKFISTDPLSPAGWIEANSWQATWGVSHDISGLAKLMGGKAVLSEKLNYAFEKALESDFVAEYGQGYISYGNQPALSDAHVFNYAGKPWLTQRWVRIVKEKSYGGISPDLGYGGQDEDQGQMGALSALMGIGLFNLQGNVNRDPVYDITSPIFDEVTIKLDPKYYKGKQFVIKTHHNSAENLYIQKATLNGKALNRFWFRHADFAKGGELHIWLGPKPNKQWGIVDLPPGDQVN
ncbi:alpha-1,2-mannosidase, putative [Pedobacter steynii]|uniref:Alpha-1,2-mannosidase, putative n=1 Tax=Pedobacter steynii TaxID=430522 RepID=A0A1G9USK6_9SPHI|nr:GH92 family glycosyl hydrolase [Pedobacter steynii]NQX40862.1 glycoside hydrolase family 92 protein [Pedobacter steynii]SDM62882.1 alpha-1,2-mannosidase, putative [Pedobacter steynii]